MLLMLGQVPALVVSSAETAKEVLKTHDHIFASRPSLLAPTIVFYGGKDIPFAPYGEHWRQLKKLCVNRLLSTKMVQSFRHIREDEVASLVSKISDMSSSSVVINMSEVLNSFVSRFLCRVLFGNHLREEDSLKTISNLIEELTKIVSLLSISDCIPSLGWFDKFIGLTARAKHNFKEWDSLLEEIVNEHEKRSSELKEEEMDFTDVLHALQKDEDMELPLNRVAIKTILLDAVTAGINGPSLTLDWGMAELARNPGMMKKLQEEVRGIAKVGCAVREEELSKMSYLKAVIKETLRLHPPAPLLIPHQSIEHCRLMGYEISEQTTVIVNAWAIARDPKIWEEAEKFRPERFIGSSVDYRGNDFEFIPFSAGRRMCPGIQFATAIIELAFANLVNMFDWELPVGMRCADMDMTESPGLTSRRRQTLHLIAKPREI